LIKNEGYGMNKGDIFVKIDLTRFAKSIFGDDVVQEAYTVEYIHVNEEYDEKEWLEDTEDDYNDNSILPPNGGAFVKFNNGKSFMIWTSEMGGVQTMTEQEFKEREGDPGKSFCEWRQIIE
jgi:hypothetical protein